MKKVLASLLAAALSLSLLAGCGGESIATSSTTTGSEAGADESLQKVLDSGEFILGLDATFMPMGYTDENDEIVGFDIDVAEEVCNRMGVKLVKKGIEWSANVATLNAGTIDCVWNGMSWSETRNEEMNLSEPYMKNEMVFVVTENSDVQASADLNGKRVAVQSGSTAQEMLADSELQVEAVELGTNVEALQQLELGLVDGVFLDSVVANYEITQNNSPYRVLPDGLSEEDYVIGFRKNDQALRDKVQETLKEMKADGKLAEISTKWFGSDVTTVE